MLSFLKELFSSTPMPPLTEEERKEMEYHYYLSFPYL